MERRSSQSSGVLGFPAKRGYSKQISNVVFLHQFIGGWEVDAYHRQIGRKPQLVMATQNSFKKGKETVLPHTTYS